MAIKRDYGKPAPVRRMVWTEANVQARLIEHTFTAPGSRAVGFAPNVLYGRWSADLLLVLASGFVTEFEIKLSRADFLADLVQKCDKHNFMQAAAFHKVPEFVMPNRLMFVLPAHLEIGVDQVPNHAGLTCIADDGRLCVARAAPLIHRVKFPALENLTTPLSWRLAKRIGPAQYETLTQ